MLGLRKNHLKRLHAVSLNALVVSTLALTALQSAPTSASHESPAAGTTSTAAATAAARTAGDWKLDRRLEDSEIRESSGLSRSTYDRKILFTHNDSGDGPRFFAVGRQGGTRATFSLRNATARDWEDMATGPDHTLWFADIGDNREARDSISLYRVREPRSLESRSLKSKRFDFRYPKGRAHDSEALMVRGSGRVFLVSKTRNNPAVFRAPRQLSTSHVNQLTRVASAPDLVTGGAWFRGSSRYVLRTHNWAYVYAKLGGRPREVRLPDEKQGESIEAARGGSSIFTGSEGPDSPVHKVYVGR